MQKERKGLLVPFVFMLVTVGILIKLGFWQLEQKQRKDSIIIRIEQRAGAEPLVTNVKDLSIQTKSTDDLDYTSVALTGRFLHETEIAVFTNREMGSAQYAGPGYDILTLFKDKNGGLILVNRGFVPQDFRQGKSRLSGQTQEDINITGLIRKPERHSYADVPDRPERSEFAVRDPKTIIDSKLKNEQKQLEAPVINSFYIDLRSPVPEGGLPSPNKTNVSIPNRHLEYVVTWWGLALVITGMFGVFVRQRFKQV